MNTYLFSRKDNMAKRKIIRIFECWQSDDKETQKYIRKALKMVSEKINLNKELSFGVEIDRDTQNIVGSVDIKKVILDKIDKCDMFICDISSVGKNDKTGDMIINNNVAFELGYVCGRKKVTGNILLANEDTTDLKELPFDIRNLRIKTFSPKTDKNSKELTHSLIEIIKSYVNETSGELYKDEEEDLIKAIENGRAPRSKADPVIRRLYEEYIRLYPRDFKADTYLDETYNALIQTNNITTRLTRIIVTAIDYEQYEVIESVYNNLEIVLNACCPKSTNSFHDSQLEYSAIICSDLMLIILGILTDRNKWEIIHQIKEKYSPIVYFNKKYTISMNDFSELRAPRNLMSYTNSKDNESYYFPISILEKDMHQETNSDVLKYIVSGDLLNYLTNIETRWYFPQSIGLMFDNSTNILPKFMFKYIDRNGFNEIKTAMNYRGIDSARRYVWNKIVTLGQDRMLFDPLKEIFAGIGIKTELDLWKKGQPSVAAIL